MQLETSWKKTVVNLLQLWEETEENLDTIGAGWPQQWPCLSSGSVVQAETGPWKLLGLVSVSLSGAESSHILGSLEIRELMGTVSGGIFDDRRT